MTDELKECPTCHGDTVWFERKGLNTQVYVCPKIKYPEYNHPLSDDEINAMIKRQQNRAFQEEGLLN